MQTPRNKRLKVLHVLVNPLPGGMEVLMLNVLKKQHQNDVCDSSVAVVYGADHEHSMKSEIEEVASFHNLDSASFFSLGFISKFRKLMREEKPDVVHAWSYDSGLVAGFVARFLYGAKVVWGIHALELPSRDEYTAFRFTVLKTLVGVGSRIIPHKIISCAKSATESHVKFGYPRKKCIDIANGIDVNRFKPDSSVSSRLRKDLNIDASAPVIGYVGRNHPVKCLENYFGAVALLMESRPDAHFVALGLTKDNLYPKAKEAYDQLPDPSRIHLLGCHPDPENYMPGFTINVLSSSSEALPMVLMEALSCGVPCVTTDVGSAREVVGSAGKCVIPNDPNALADAANSLLNEVLLDQAAWATQAREHCLENYSIIMTEKKHTEVYSKVSGIRAGANAESPSVLHLVNGLARGGAEVLLMRLTKGLKTEGFNQSVVAVLPDGALAPEFEKTGIRIETLGVKGLFSGVRGIFRLASMIRREKPDLIQTWMYHSALIGEIAALLSFRFPKTLWSIHHTTLGKESSKFTTRVVHRILAALSFRMPERIIYCSQASVDIHHEGKFDKAQTELIFNGTDTAIYHADPDAKKALRAEFGIPMDAPLVGMAGRYHPQKDFANLLKAFAILQETNPHAHLMGCGTGVTRETAALRELADACPNPSNVHLVGPRMNMPKVYPAFSISALSSCEGEAFPLVLGEAMACEVPCVATDVGDSALIIGNTGHIVPPRDSKALAAALKKLMDLSPDELSVYGKKSRQRVEDQFTLKTYVQSHAKLYRSILPESCVAKLANTKQVAVESGQLVVSQT